MDHNTIHFETGYEQGHKDGYNDGYSNGEFERIALATANSELRSQILALTQHGVDDMWADSDGRRVDL